MVSTCFGQPVLQARQLQLGGRVVEEVVLPREPAEEAADRHEARVLARKVSGWPFRLRQ